MRPTVILAILDLPQIVEEQLLQLGKIFHLLLGRGYGGMSLTGMGHLLTRKWVLLVLMVQ